MDAQLQKPRQRRNLERRRSADDTGYRLGFDTAASLCSTAATQVDGPYGLSETAADPDGPLGFRRDCSC